MRTIIMRIMKMIMDLNMVLIGDVEVLDIDLLPIMITVRSKKQNY